ncbi:hypothetical protein BC831DRAFT_447722 [Entophlyctis helioformis]|nr:hypothetical protein BC831DRAFT_447722 [Entophlyctis helioformis]
MAAVSAMEPASLHWSLALSGCLSLSAVFVGSFYLFPGALSKSRNDSDVIVQRFQAVGLTSAIGLASVTALFAWLKPGGSLADTIGAGLAATGLVSSSPISSVLTSLGLTMALFLGPLCLEGPSLMAHVRTQLEDPTKRLILCRNWIVGPIAEEFVFRGCMVPLMLAGGFSETQTVWRLPMFFGIAHLHHAWEMARDGGLSRAAILRAAATTAFQFLYTSVFGWMATYYFIRTGSIFGPIASHMFCNIVGFPDLDVLFQGSRLHRARAWLLYVAGILLFVANTWYR